LIIIRYSEKWKNWLTIPDEKLCIRCEEKHGKIYAVDEAVNPSPPLHRFCRCYIERLKSIFAGEATIKGTDGADWHLKYTGKLPEYYISKTDAIGLGWNKNHKKLSDVAPGYMIYGGIYRNKNSHLPDKKGRIWYEADIDYEAGHRHTKRIVFSNDGLIFVTYDHYETFIEVR